MPNEKTASQPAPSKTRDEKASPSKTPASGKAGGTRNAKGGEKKTTP